MRCVALFCSGHQHFNLNCLYWVALDSLDNLPFSGTLDVNNFGYFIIDFYWLPVLLFSNYKLQITCDCRKIFCRHMQHYLYFGYGNSINGDGIRSVFIIWLQLFSYTIQVSVLNWILKTGIRGSWCRIRGLTSERNFEH